MNSEEYYKKVGEAYDLDPRVVKAIINNIFENIIAISHKTNFLDIDSEEKFNETKTNIRIPGLGKLITDYYKVRKINKSKANGNKKD